jgi:hypothetical protein
MKMMKIMAALMRLTRALHVEELHPTHDKDLVRAPSDQELTPFH